MGKRKKTNKEITTTEESKKTNENEATSGDAATEEIGEAEHVVEAQDAEDETQEAEDGDEVAQSVQGQDAEACLQEIAQQASESESTRQDTKNTSRAIAELLAEKLYLNAVYTRFNVNRQDNEWYRLFFRDESPENQIPHNQLVVINGKKDGQGRILICADKITCKRKEDAEELTKLIRQVLRSEKIDFTCGIVCGRDTGWTFALAKENPTKSVQKVTS
jgi:transcriptional regulator of heat shock response